MANPVSEANAAVPTVALRSFSESAAGAGRQLRRALDWSIVSLV